MMIKTNVIKISLVFFLVSVTACKTYTMQKQIIKLSEKEESQLLAMKKNDIFNAITKDNIARVKEIIKKDPSKVNAINKFDQNALHIATIYDRTTIIKLLLKKGADTKLKNSKGYTPLHYAARHGYTDIAELLINKGAEIDSKNNDDKTPFDLAEQNANTEIITLFKLEELLNQLKTNSKKDTFAEIDKLFTNTKTLLFIKRRAITKLIKIRKKDSKLISGLDIKKYIKKIPFNFQTLNSTTIIRFAFNNNVIDMHGRPIKMHFVCTLLQKQYHLF